MGKQKPARKKPTVGVIGLGNMGPGIARNLAKAGHPVLVWDLNEAARAPFETARNIAIAPPAEMAAKSALIFFVVPASPQVAACLGGRDGVLAHAKKNLVLYDLTTSDPIETKKLARRAAKKNVTYLDAGMSGGARGADTGNLSLMVGGDEKAFRRTRKILDTIAADVFYLGKSGAGHTCKLIHNMVCHTIFLATCEGGKMAEKAGIDVADLIDVFNASNARSFISEVRFPNHIISGKWDGRSRVYNLYKDTGMAVALAQTLKVDAKLGADTHDFFARALALGMEDQDFTRVYKDFDKIKSKK